MKRREHRVIQIDLPDKEAFWLTKAMYKYNYHSWRYQNGKTKGEPYAYIPTEDSRIILNGDYRRRIDYNLISSGHLERKVIGISKYDKEIPGYVTILENVKFTKKFNKCFDVYAEYITYKFFIRHLLIKMTLLLK